jgi:glycosyltransferase involved in cell wall biosynthesis
MIIGEVGVFGLYSNDTNADKVPKTGLAFWKTTTVPAPIYWLPGQKMSSRAWFLDPVGHPSDMSYSETVAAELDGIMTNFNPHLVVIEGLWLHRYIDVLKCHNCRIVLDNHNVEAAVVQEIANSTFGDDLPARLIRDVMPERTRAIEQKAAGAVDQVWVCSSEDARLMNKLYGSSMSVHVVPNAVNISYYIGVHDGKYPRPNSVAPTRNTIIFPASFRWEPNVNAAAFLTEKLFPLLVAIYPDCQLMLVGKDPTPQMTEVAKRDPRIVVTGRVYDVRPYLAASSVMVTPLFQGGGTRFKILEAFASNIPVISTKKGAEGLDVKDGTHLLIAESAEEFVMAVQRILRNESIAKQLIANGWDLVQRLYSWQTSGLCIAQAIGSFELGG